MHLRACQRGTCGVLPAACRVPQCVTAKLARALLLQPRACFQALQLPLSAAPASLTLAGKQPVKRRCTCTEFASTCACRQVTPVWRAGPYGPKTLCNACGVRYMKQVKKK